MRSIAAGSKARPTALALFAGALASLAIGHFIQFDDSTGFGSDRWVRLWGYLAAVLALGSLVAALPRREARRSLGLALAVLSFTILCVTLADGAFRFIWHAGEGELFLLELGLGLVAAFLLVPRWVATDQGDEKTGPRVPPAWARVTLYACLTVVFLFAAFFAGTAHYQANGCPDSSGDCDLAGLEGLVWAGVAVTVTVTVIAVAELTLALSRLRRRQRGRQPRSSRKAG